MKANGPSRTRMGRAGITLVELLIAVAIIAAAVPAGILSYRYASKSILGSKYRTVASNLAQEKVQTLKNVSSYLLPVTHTSVTDNRVQPPIDYDNVNFSLETLQENGIEFQRATRVDYAHQLGSTITPVPWTNGDTGLKKITVYTFWRQDNEWRRIEFSNLVASQATDAENATFRGTVTDASTSAPIQGAYVKILENSSWMGVTDAAGHYSINVSSGIYSLQCAPFGFDVQMVGNHSIGPGQVHTVDFSLTTISSGTVSAEVYISTHLVISQVVADIGGTGGEEYIELYNPTTSQILMKDVFSKTCFKYFDSANPLGIATMLPNPNYAATPSIIQPSGFYLIANVPAVHVNGDTITADVTYAGTLITEDIEGGISLYNNSAGNCLGSPMDSLSWAGPSNPGPTVPKEGQPIHFNLAPPPGLRTDEAYVRSTHPGGLASGFGRAYDSNNNANDFVSIYPINAAVTPRNSTTIWSPLTGSPATGANIGLSDSASEAAQATDAFVTGCPSPPGCRFSQFKVAVGTGTWTLFGQLGGRFGQVDNITVLRDINTDAPNNTTTPAATGLAIKRFRLDGVATPLTSLTGVITDALGSPLRSIQVDAAGTSGRTNTAGRYWLAVAPGLHTITVNSDGNNPAYISTSTVLNAPTIGAVYTRNFSLPKTGQLKGLFQTTSNSPLPGRIATAYKDGRSIGQARSGGTGFFYFNDITTGTYIVVPSSFSNESVTPPSATVDALGGPAVLYTTFTVTANSQGQIHGQVTSAGDPIKTGALLIASLASAPTSLNGGLSGDCDPSSTSAASACYYMTSSDSTGSYSLSVPFNNSGNYRVYAYYTTYNGTTPVVTQKTSSGISVTTSNPVHSQDFAW